MSLRICERSPCDCQCAFGYGVLPAVAPGGRGICGCYGSEDDLDLHSVVILSLHTPREKVWGELLTLNTAGVTLRGIDLNSFDDFVHQVLHPEGERVGL